MFGGLFCNFAIMAKGRNKQLIDERDKKLFLSEATTLRIIKRMLVEGATVNGTAVKKSRYMGFRSSRRQTASAVQPSLFPESPR